MPSPHHQSADTQPAAIVLAAGASQRFGAHKLSQTLTIAGKKRPIVVHTLEQWLQVFTHCVLVVRPADRQLSDALAVLSASQRTRVHLIEAGEAQSGMAYSLRAGVAATAEASGWVIGLADMPWLPTAALMRVKQAMEAGASVAAPFYQGRRGHPVGFAREWAPQLLDLTGDTGARSILQQTSRLEVLNSDSPDVLRDIDTPADMT